MSTATKARVDTAYQRLREHLAYLGLSTAAEELAPALDRAAKQKLSPVEVLEDLLAREAEATRARRLHGRLRFAHYPLRKTLPEFEFDYQPSIDRKVFGELSSLRFVEERRNVLLLGPPGVGKTHLAISLGIAATEAGYRTYFTTASDLVAALQSAHLEGNASAKMRTFTGPSVLVVDELVYLPMDQTSAHWIFQVVSRRYERGSIHRLEAPCRPGGRSLRTGAPPPGGRCGAARVPGPMTTALQVSDGIPLIEPRGSEAASLPQSGR